MSKNYNLYVKDMNVSESEIEDVIFQEEIWDDKKLNDAYDKALKIANAEVARRIAMSTNTYNNKEDQPINRKNSNKGSKNKKKVETIQWKEGMYCRAIYIDGVEYEAVLLKFLQENECLIKFIGYNNIEIVVTTALKPSNGEAVREQQIKDALVDKTDEAYASPSTSNGSDIATSSICGEKTSCKKKKAGKKKKNAHVQGETEFNLPDMPFGMPNMNSLRNLGLMDMPLPPPPPLLSRSDSEDQAVSSMLLSWYMSGYYTGLYQGLKSAKENRKEV